MNCHSSNVVAATADSTASCRSAGYIVRQPQCCVIRIGISTDIRILMILDHRVRLAVWSAPYSPSGIGRVPCADVKSASEGDPVAMRGTHLS